jgi:hypothetical protein
MRLKAFGFAAFIPAVFLVSCGTDKSVVPAEHHALSSHVWFAGEPVAEARRQALSDWPVKGEITPDRIKKCFEISSQATMMQFFVFLYPFSAGEEKLIRRVLASQPPIVSRTAFSRLKGILAQRALLSPREAVKRGVIADRAVTPGSEDLLLGAFDCVFATVGPWSGAERYGDVIIRLKDSARTTGWATPWSGFSFLHWIRKKDTDRIDALIHSNYDPGIDNDDRLLYLMFVVDGKDWNLALGYEAVIFLRAQEQLTQAQRDGIIERALDMETPEKFWTFFLGKHYGKGPMGYLEAKFPAFVPADYFESIEVPADKFDEVMSWPESEPFRKIIKVSAEKPQPSPPPPK